MDHKPKKRPASSQLSRESKKKHLIDEKPKKKAVPVTSTTNDPPSSDEESQTSDVDLKNTEQDDTAAVAKPVNGAGEFFSQPIVAIPNSYVHRSRIRVSSVTKSATVTTKSI